MAKPHVTYELCEWQEYIEVLCEEIELVLRKDDGWQKELIENSITSIAYLKGLSAVLLLPCIGPLSLSFSFVRSTQL